MTKPTIEPAVVVARYGNCLWSRQQVFKGFAAISFAINKATLISRQHSSRWDGQWTDVITYADCYRHWLLGSIG